MILDKDIKIFHFDSKDLTLVNDIRKDDFTTAKEELLATTEEKKVSFNSQLDSKRAFTE